MKIEIKVREKRNEKGYSLEQLAHLTKISISHLGYVERNEKEPSISMLCRIALALKCDVKELYKVII